MNKEALLERIKELRTALEQSAQNHNSLLGRIAEATHIFEQSEAAKASEAAASEAHA